MSHHPYPKRARALHQLDRHTYERNPNTPPADQLRATIYRAYGIPPRLLGIPSANASTRAETPAP